MNENDNQPKAASIAKVAVWERNVPSLRESGNIDMGYVDELLQAGESTIDPAIKELCMKKLHAHTSIGVTFE